MEVRMGVPVLPRPTPTPHIYQIEPLPLKWRGGAPR